MANETDESNRRTVCGRPQTDGYPANVSINSSACGLSTQSITRTNEEESPSWRDKNSIIEKCERFMIIRMCTCNDAAHCAANRNTKVSHSIFGQANTRTQTRRSITLVNIVCVRMRLYHLLSPMTLRARRGHLSCCRFYFRRSIRSGTTFDFVGRSFRPASSTPDTTTVLPNVHDVNNNKNNNNNNIRLHLSLLRRMASADSAVCLCVCVQLHIHRNPNDVLVGKTK